MSDNNWSVYVIICGRYDKKPTLYCGATNNFAKRFQAHCDGKGAKYTRANKPRCGIEIFLNLNKSQALAMERHFKKQTSEKKWAHLRSQAIHLGQVRHNPNRIHPISD
jgi:putative endonuclease